MSVHHVAPCWLEYYTMDLKVKKNELKIVLLIVGKLVCVFTKCITEHDMSSSQDLLFSIWLHKNRTVTRAQVKVERNLVLLQWKTKLWRWGYRKRINHKVIIIIIVYYYICVCGCDAFWHVFDESLFIFHELNTHVPLLTLVALMGKLQTRQIHFDFNSGHLIFLQK